MDEFLSMVGVQAMRYAIRSGVALTSKYALGQCSRILSKVEDKALFTRLDSLHKLLESKIKIISPALDLIELKSGRGNTFLESAAPLAKSLQNEIASLGRQIEAVTVHDSKALDKDLKHRMQTVKQTDLLFIISSIEHILEKIDRDIPLFQLAISASGESLSTSVPAGISPSRLLQASTFLIIGDTQFAQDPSKPVQIGPSFTLSLYMLFLGHASTLAPHGMDMALGMHEANGVSQDTVYDDRKRPYGLGEGERKPLWQEVLHKARVRLCRTQHGQVPDTELDHYPIYDGEKFPSSPYNNKQYSYHLEIIEDLDDGRLHDMEDISPYQGVTNAGIRELIPIHQLSKIFYTDTGSILNIGNPSSSEQNPVLLLKRDSEVISAPNLSEDAIGTHVSPIATIDEDDGTDEQAEIDQQLFQEDRNHKNTTELNKDTHIPHAKWRFPSHLDPEWIALEVFQEAEEGDVDGDTNSVDSEAISEPEGSSKRSGDKPPLDPNLIDQIKRISLQSEKSSSSKSLAHVQDTVETRDFVARSPFGAITTSLSLMELLIRLTSLQEYQQASHLSIPDHILTFFLEETSTTGLVGEAQWAARSMAKRRMGFDPYTDASTK